MDKFVADTFGKDTSRDFDNVYNKSNCISDVKVSAKTWISTMREQLEELEKVVDALPDDGLDKQTYFLDEETDELVE